MLRECGEPARLIQNVDKVTGSPECAAAHPGTLGCRSGRYPMTVRGTGSFFGTEGPAVDIVSVRSLTKRYDEIGAVQDLSFAIVEGEIFGLLGPNGAGKTTTLSMLSGLIPPTSGTASVGDHDIVREARQVKRLIGLVPQDLALYPTLSARENLTFFGRIYGLSGKLLRARVDEALAVV